MEGFLTTSLMPKTSMMSSQCPPFLVTLTSVPKKIAITIWSTSSMWQTWSYSSTCTIGGGSRRAWSPQACPSWGTSRERGTRIHCASSRLEVCVCVYSNMCIHLCAQMHTHTYTLHTLAHSTFACTQTLKLWLCITYTQNYLQMC